MNYKKAFEVNKETWNKKVAIHAASQFYDMDGFKKGNSSLNSYELEALDDVAGKSILHLQCHFGQDTLSWARLGAKCTGVDISEDAIELAKKLRLELGLDANFICCNVLDTSRHISKTFDIVFTSYGTIGWLPDLKPWAKMISERLKPRGCFYIIDFHPIAWMFDYQESPPSLSYGYHQEEVIYEEYRGTYAKPDSDMISKEYGWNHSMSDLINALISNGLKLEYLNEYDASPYNVFPNLMENVMGHFELKEKLFPLLFELKVTKEV